jgi:dihydrofolate reductase
MGSLIAMSLTSLDGYVNDRQGRFEWAEPDPEVHAFVNDAARSIGTYLLGRRLYEVMVVWETLELQGEPDHVRDFAQLWRAADKIVYSRTLGSVEGAGARLERTFDPDAVRRLKATSDRDLSIGGPGLAAHAFRAGLVDEVGLFLSPVAVGGGTPFFPADLRIDLDLTDQRRFGNGMVFVRYRVRGEGGPAG